MVLAGLANAITSMVLVGRHTISIALGDRLRRRWGAALRRFDGGPLLLELVLGHGGKLDDLHQKRGRSLLCIVKCSDHLGLP